MIDSRTLIPIGCLLVTGALGLAQTPAVAPVPPAPTGVPSAPTPARAPRAATAPAIRTAESATSRGTPWI